VIGDVRELFDFLALHLELVPHVERAGVGEHEMALPSFNLPEGAQDFDAINRAGRSGDADDQALRHGG
jgi:hypothetical protein